MDNYKLVSIAAYDRSGTTFLGGLLNEYENTFYIGELDQGFSLLTNKDKTLCTCGANIEDCEVWANLNKQFNGEKNKTQVVYDYIHSKTKASIIIDSSKQLNQVTQNNAHNQQNQVLIHLIRNPKGVIHSRMKTTKRLLKKQMHPKPFLGNQTTLLLVMDSLDWCYRNIRLEQYKKQRKHISVIYENLDTKYNSHILPFLKENVNLILDNKEEAVPHILGGNINRYNGIGDIKIDYSWKEGLSSFQKFTVDLITFPVRKFYDYKF